jgi:conjugal transfer pilin signal peptidase TrbI
MNEMTFRRNCTVLLVLALAFVVSLQIISRKYGLYVVRKEHMCLPYKHLYVKKGIIPKNYDDLISFKSSGIPNFADGVTFTKMIAGLPGDRIAREIYSDEERQKHTIEFEKDGESVRLRLRGRVYLKRRGHPSPLTYDVIEKDSLGRELPMIEEMVIPEGKYFVTGTEDRTFDSRYYGVIHEEQVIGQAFPLPFQQKKI